jgi:hypothetical protein
MYLFSRRARLAPGDTQSAMTWATGITEKVTQITGLNVSLFTPIFSPEVGMLSWSTFVPDLATLEDATDKLAVDTGYISMVDEGAKFSASGADDALLQIVYGQPNANRKVEYVTSVATTCANGSVGRGIELGVEIAQRVEKILGLPGMFATATTGSYGSVAWLTGYADVKELEASQQKLAADTKFAEFIDKSVPGVYTDEPTASQQRILRRIV